jgi:plastocyanin
MKPGGFTEDASVTLFPSLVAQAGTSELVNLSATSTPSGLNATFIPASPVTLRAGVKMNVTVFVTASSNATPTNYTVSVSGVSGGNTASASFNVRVVQNLVLMINSAFKPTQLNVTAGSTVFWQNLDGPSAQCGQTTGTGVHSVVFTTIAANSSALHQFGVFSYTFTTPGNYFYYSGADSDHLMNGTISVTGTAGGVAGMVFRMPAFSHFKGGTPAVITAPTPKTASSTNPFGAIAAASPVVADGLALAALIKLGAGFPTFSGLGVGAGIAMLFSLFALALAPAMSTRGKRKMTALGFAVIRLARLSD